MAKPPPDDAWFYISGEELRRIRAVASKLYQERRLDGNQMRDLGHVLTGVVATAELLPATEPKENG